MLVNQIHTIKKIDVTDQRIISIGMKIVSVYESRRMRKEVGGSEQDLHEQDH